MFAYFHLGNHNTWGNMLVTSVNFRVFLMVPSFSLLLLLTLLARRFPPDIRCGDEIRLNVQALFRPDVPHDEAERRMHPDCLLRPLCAKRLLPNGWTDVPSTFQS